MSPLPIVKSLSRVSSRSVLTHPPRRYATSGPPMSQGGGLRPFLIAALAATPILAYYLIPSRDPDSMAQELEIKRPKLDPAARKRERKEKQGEPDTIFGTKYIHPEHKDPEEFRPAFGQQHRRKRVDDNPDGRHHQSLNDRARRE